MSIDRNQAILEIRKALKVRSSKAWSVTGGRGTAWGWIEISAPPRRRVEYDYMTEADQAELGQLLGLSAPAHPQGVQIPSQYDYRQEYIDRANGRTPTLYGHSDWD